MVSDWSVHSYDERPITGQAVRRLYDLQGWWPERAVDDIDAVLRAYPSVGAWLDDELVGFARAITDGRFHAYAEDVVVDPAARGRGVGRALVERLAEQLGPVPLVSLFCGSDLVDFYTSSGFRATGQVVLHRPLRSDA